MAIEITRMRKTKSKIRKQNKAETNDLFFHSEIMYNLSTKYTRC